jgi:hypothetical protein
VLSGIVKDRSDRTVAEKACGSGSDVQLRSLAIPVNSLLRRSLRERSYRSGQTVLQDVATDQLAVGKSEAGAERYAGSGRQQTKQGREGEVNAKDSVIMDGYKSAQSGMIGTVVIQG